MRVYPEQIKDSKTNISYGPLKDLENHVNPEWWKYLFNSLYIKTDGDVINDDLITSSESQLFIDLLNLPKNAAILDTCCGQGRHSFAFYKRGYTNIEGIDRSSYLISRARKENIRIAGSIKFREGDARKLPFKENVFDAVMILGNSFGYFESSNDDLQVLQSAARILKKKAKILIDIADGNFLRENFKERSWEWINKKQFVCRERCLSSTGKKLISREVIIQSDKGVIADQFYSENLYNAKDIQTLLEEAGFTNVIISQNLKVKSQRNQDLGMMENRLILTAIVDKD